VFFSGRDRNEVTAGLSTDLEAYYAEAYSGIASSGSFGLASRLQHRQMERYSLVRELSGQRILEVGAGRGQHIAFVDPDSWTEYLQTDLRPPAEVNPGDGSWISESVDASSLPLPDQSFDRLISTCVLAHTDDPSLTLKEWRRVVRPGGLITLYLPTESSLALNFLRLLGPRQARIKAGFDPRIIFLDHRYNYRYLKTLIELEFEGDQSRSRRFPRLFPWWLSLWEIVQIKI